MLKHSDSFINIIYLMKKSDSGRRGGEEKSSPRNGQCKLQETQL